jgi:hypothetical protein
MAMTRIAPDVVDDRQREQQDAKGRRDARSEQDEYAYCEGDVGRRGHPPPLARRRACVQEEVDRDRDDHPPDRCGHGKHGPPELGQFAVVDLPAHFEPDQQEEPPSWRR